MPVDSRLAKAACTVIEPRKRERVMRLQFQVKSMFHVPQVTPTLWPYGKVNVRKPSQIQTLITTNKDDVEDNGLTMLVSKDECFRKRHIRTCFYR